ncbi:hypothetical protein HAX54_007564 [Datura stramonium]|uniref:Transposase MuDR plant domain-containing protein n=1 Tax=Datura stramonium TaxID=4076 RepID=A0ABS8WUR1_DATST|nr:hypothetical protein [Datura stramonium]
MKGKKVPIGDYGDLRECLVDHDHPKNHEYDLENYVAVESSSSHSFPDGTCFKSGDSFLYKKALDTSLQQAFMKNHFNFKTLKSKSHMYLAVCADKTCMWRLHANKSRREEPDAAEITHIGVLTRRRKFAGESKSAHRVGAESSRVGAVLTEP